MEVEVIARKRPIDNERLEKIEEQLALSLSALSEKNDLLSKTAKRMRELENQAVPASSTNLHVGFVDQCVDACFDIWTC